MYVHFSKNAPVSFMPILNSTEKIFGKNNCQKTQEPRKYVYPVPCHVTNNLSTF